MADVTLTPQAQSGLDYLKTANPSLASNILSSGFNEAAPVDAQTLTQGSQFNLPTYTPPVTSNNTAPPPGWDATTYANFKSANPTLEPDAYDTGVMQGTITPQGSQPIDFGVTKDQNAVDSTQSELKTAEDQQGQKSAVQSQLEDQQGVPGINSTLQELYAKDANYAADLSNLNSNELQTDLTSEDRFAPTSAISGEQAQAARQKAFLAQNVNIQRATNSAAITAAQGRLSLANDYITKALDAQFTPIASQIDYLKTVLTQNQSNLSDAEKEQLQYQITQQQNALDQQKSDKTDIYNVLLAAAQNGADANTLRTIQSATTPEDAIAAAGNSLNTPKTQVVNANGRALLVNTQTGQTIADLGTNDAALSLSSSTNGVSVQLNDGSTTTIPSNLAPYFAQSTSGVPYVDLSALSAGEKGKLAPLAAQQGYGVIVNANEAVDLKNIQNAINNLDTMQSTFASITSPNTVSRLFNNIGLNPVATALQTSPQKVAAGTLNDAAQDILKSISGVQGARFSAAMIDQVKENLPTIYDTTATANTKINTVRSLIANREDALLNQPSTVNSGTDLRTQVTNAGYNYDAMKDAGYTDAQIKAALGQN
jgi:hypothetical protein